MPVRTLIILLASAGYIGYIPIASGTFGSLVGIPFFFLFDRMAVTSPFLTLAVFVAAVLGSCWVAGRAEEYFHEHDSHKIVIDEVVGYIAATLFLPVNLWTIGLAFVVFRVYDVVKPFPAGYIDANLQGGYGVVLDDVMSGIYANLTVRLLFLFASMM